MAEKLRRLSAAVQEKLEPPQWRPPETGPKPYPLPPEFEHSFAFDPPSTGMVVLDPAWLRDARWMQRNQAKVNKLFQEGRVRLEGTEFRWQGRQSEG